MAYGQPKKKKGFRGHVPLVPPPPGYGTGVDYRLQYTHASMAMKSKGPVRIVCVPYLRYDLTLI